MNLRAASLKSDSTWESEMGKKHVHFRERTGHTLQSTLYAICRCGYEQYNGKWEPSRKRITWDDLTPEQAASIIGARRDINDY